MSGQDKQNSSQPVPAGAQALQPPSIPLTAQVKPQSVKENDPAKPALSPAARTEPVTYLAHAQKRTNKKHQAEPRYASRGSLFSSLMDDWYRAVGL